MTTDHEVTPTAGARLRRPRWRDPRLVVGLLLVLASVAGVVALVSSGQRTQAYWAAARDLGPGVTVESGDLVKVEANLADTAGHYLPADEPPPSDRVLTGALRGGELVPARTLAAVDPHGRRPVGVELSEPLPTGTGVGDRVDVWVAPPREDGRGHGEPTRVAEALEIAELAEDAGGLGGRPVVRVQVMVGEGTLPRLLEAKTTEARITVVPALGER